MDSAAGISLQQSPRAFADVPLVLQVMREQETGGKIFFIDGTGAWGNPTPQNVAYGAAKRAITQVKVGSSTYPVPYRGPYSWPQWGRGQYAALCCRSHMAQPTRTA